MDDVRLTAPLFNRGGQVKATIETTDAGLRIELDDAGVEMVGRVGAGLFATVARLAQLPVVGLRFENRPPLKGKGGRGGKGQTAGA